MTWDDIDNLKTTLARDARAAERRTAVERLKARGQLRVFAVVMRGERVLSRLRGYLGVHESEPDVVVVFRSTFNPRKPRRQRVRVASIQANEGASVVGALGASVLVALDAWRESGGRCEPMRLEAVDG